MCMCVRSRQTLRQRDRDRELGREGRRGWGEKEMEKWLI